MPQTDAVRRTAKKQSRRRPLGGQQEMYIYIRRLIRPGVFHSPKEGGGPQVQRQCKSSAWVSAAVGQQYSTSECEVEAGGGKLQSHRSQVPTVSPVEWEGFCANGRRSRGHDGVARKPFASRTRDVVRWGGGDGRSRLCARSENAGGVPQDRDVKAFPSGHSTYLSICRSLPSRPACFDVPRSVVVRLRLDGVVVNGGTEAWP